MTSESDPTVPDESDPTVPDAADEQAAVRAFDALSAERRRKRDDNRWQLFRRFASKAQDVAEARRLIAALKGKGADPAEMVGERSVGEWIEWAEERIRRDDPLLMEPKDLFSSLAAVSEWNYRPED